MSNKAMRHGAAGVLLPDAIRKLQEGHALPEGDVVLLPSSVHEWLLLSDSMLGEALQDLAKIICEVNGAALAPEEILSDHAYKYVAETGEIICL